MWCLALLLCLCTQATASDSATSEESFVVELNEKTFEKELSAQKYENGQCLVEFYAGWCPHCQHYKATYDQIGRFFNADPRPNPLIWVARIDCAEQGNYPICDKFKVKGYPTIYLGPVEHFREPNADKLVSVSPKPAAEVVSFISKKLKTEYSYEEEKVLSEVQEMKQRRREKDLKMDIDDIERATVELFDRLVQSDVILETEEVREGFVHWVELLAKAHPSKRCRKSASFLKRKMGSLWPQGKDRPSPILKRFHMCTIKFKAKEWDSCAGSTPQTRGFTCGLWQLLHALTVGVGDEQAPLWVSGVEAFAKYFFGCAECARHFLKAMKKRDAASVTSRKELILWLWATHNTVNARIREEEAESGTGDPKFPKVQWPPQKLCPICQPADSDAENPDWKESKVLRFLEDFYGEAVNEDDAGEVSLTTGRKELKNRLWDLDSIDVFSQEDATAMELQEKGGLDLTVVVFIVMVLIAVFLIRRSKRRKIIPISKDIL